MEGFDKITESGGTPRDLSKKPKRNSTKKKSRRYFCMNSWKVPEEPRWLVSEEIFEEDPGGVPELISGEFPKGVPEEIWEDIPKGVSGEISPAISKEISQRFPGKFLKRIL